MKIQRYSFDNGQWADVTDPDEGFPDVFADLLSIGEYTYGETIAHPETGVRYRAVKG